MTRVAVGSYPPVGASVTREQLDELLATLGAWLNDRGDRLVQLDERATIHTEKDHASDVAIAFVIWQAIGERRDELAAIPWPDKRSPSTLVADLTWRRIDDRTGTMLAANLPEAVALVDRLADGVARAIDGAEHRAAETHRRRTAVAADLDVAERLATALGDQVRAVAGVRARLETLSAGGSGATASTAPAGNGDPGALEVAAAEWSELANRAAALRAALEATDAERSSMLARLADAEATMASLREREAAARAAAADCADLVTEPPRLAVPSVDAIGVPPADIADRPWPQARPQVQSFVELVDRVGRALDIALETFRRPRRERDDLRGLLQAYRDKADAAGQAERADIDAAYRAARELLWTAPCDLAAARARCDEYQRLVNAASGTTTDAEEQP